ncbi:hypothetical protein [Actinomadura opuntiae]|uniref:hypothetical protein n=1 Tax=Actinomadura sp. OS1-43 TaxID=604315 RepID=UPI00255B0E35|nr:hypothetical protein [Actinomadura sp. OS1-43]MDL4818465.1 hypothetical protein [Actinomadura sp. OS1-43]
MLRYPLIRLNPRPSLVTVTEALENIVGARPIGDQRHYTGIRLTAGAFAPAEGDGWPAT